MSETVRVLGGFGLAIGGVLFLVAYCWFIVLIIRKDGFWTGIFAGAIPILLVGIVIGLEFKVLKRPLAVLAAALVLLVLGAVATSPEDQQRFLPTSQHRDVANQYSILYPSGWEPMPDNYVNLAKQQLPESRQLLLAVWSKNGKLNMQVTKERTDENGSLNDLYESSLASSPLPHNTVSKDEVTIDGIKAIKAVNTTTTPDGRPAKYLHLFLLHGGCVWTIGIGGAPGSFDTYLTDINKMVDSLSFEKPLK